MYAVKLICLTISFEKATPKLDSKTMTCLVWHDIVTCLRDFRGF